MARALKVAGLTTTGLVLLAAAAVGWGLARYIGGRSLYLMAYGGVAALGLGYLLGRQRRALVGRRSELPLRIREGQRVTVELELEAKRRVSAVILEERLHPHFGRPKRISIESIPGGKTVTSGYTLTAGLRGVYPVGPLVAVWTDPFGFTRHEVVLTEAQEVIVHPTTEPVDDRPLTRQWEDPPVRPPVSKPWNSGFEFYGMRDYAPGDDVRRIVWRATARSGRVLVREFEQGITDRVTLVLDTDALYHSTGDPSDSFEAAVRTVASLGVRHLKDGFAVTVETNEGNLAAALRGAGSSLPFLDAMARARSGRRPLVDAIERMLADPRRDAHNVIVTPHLDDRAAARLKLLLDRGGAVEVVALLWEESDPASLSRAAALGCQVVQLRPRQPLGAVFAHEVGAGRR
ncbi:MAG: DUF58 domain-containing protein [Candidatus Dormibacteria bacterium]